MDSKDAQQPVMISIAHLVAIYTQSISVIQLAVLEVVAGASVWDEALRTHVS